MNLKMTEGKKVKKALLVIDMQNVNWLKKGMAFLQAKFTGKKYKNVLKNNKKTKKTLDFHNPIC